MESPNRTYFEITGLLCAVLVMMGGLLYNASEHASTLFYIFTVVFMVLVGGIIGLYSVQASAWMLCFGVALLGLFAWAMTETANIKTTASIVKFVLSIVGFLLISGLTYFRVKTALPTLPYLKIPLIGFCVLSLLLFVFFADPFGWITTHIFPYASMALSIGLLVMFLTIYFSIFVKNPSDPNADKTSVGAIMSYIALNMGIVGLAIIALVLGSRWLNAASGHGSTHLITVVILLAIICAMLARLYGLGERVSRQPWMKLPLAVLNYVWCKIQLSSSSNKSPHTKLVAVGAALVSTYFIFFHYALPELMKWYFRQGGTQLVNDPISIQTETPLASYQSLSNVKDTDESKIVFDYRYALSFWVYIDSFPPSTRSAYANPSNNVISYGNMVNMIYNPLNNTFEVRTSATNRVVHVVHNVALQKWNYVVFNYTGGTLDVFYNGVLDKSVNGITPYLKQDMLVAGQKNGIYGHICNVLYFNQPISLAVIRRLYNAFSDKDPPSIPTSFSLP